MNNCWIPAITAFIIVAIIVIARKHHDHQVYRDLINGYWDASQAFCLRSDVKSAQAYFRDGKVYLLIDEGDRVVLNKCVDVDLSAQWFTSESRWDVTFGEDVDPLPEQCEMRVDMTRGMMGLFVGDVLYLELFRDNKATAGVI